MKQYQKNNEHEHKKNDMIDLNIQEKYKIKINLK